MIGFDDKSSIKVEINEFVGIFGYSFLNFGDKQRNWLKTLENIKFQLHFEVKSNARFHFVSPEDFYDEPILAINYSEFLLQAKTNLLIVKSKLGVEIKRSHEPIFESIIENLEFSIIANVLPKDLENNLNLQLDVNDCILNFKADLLETLIQIRRYAKEQKKPNNFLSFQICSELEIPFKIYYNGHDFDVIDSVMNFSLEKVPQKTKKSTILLEWLRSRKSGVLIDEFLDCLKQSKAIFFINSLSEQPKKHSNTIPNSECKITIGKLCYNLDIYQQDFIKLPISKDGFYSVIVQSSIYGLNYSLRIKTNIKFKNTTKFKLLLRIFVIENESQEKVWQKNASPIFLKNIKLHRNEEYGLPFYNSIDNLYFSLSIDSEFDILNKHSLQDLLQSKFAFVVCEDKKKKKKTYLSVDLKNTLQNSNSSQKDQINASSEKLLDEMIINIKPALKIINKLPFKFRLIFQNQNQKNLFLSSLSLSSNHLSNQEHSLPEVNCAEFSEEFVYKFALMEFNLVYVNSTSNSDFIQLREQEIQQSECLSVNSEQFIPANSDEKFVVHMQNSFESLTNAILQVKRNNEKYKLTFFSEIIFISEVDFKIRIFIEESDFEYDRIELNSHNDSENDDPGLLNFCSNYFSLEEISNKKTFNRLIKKKHRVLCPFTGNLSKISKKVIFEAADTKIEFALSSSTEKYKQVVVLNKQTINVSFLQLDNSIAQKGFFFIHYPFFLINKCEDDLVIKVYNFSDRIFILQKDHLYPCQELLPPSKSLNNCEFVTKGNSNDEDWSSNFVLFPGEKNLSDGNYFVKIKKKAQSLNVRCLCFQISSNELSKLITITVSKKPNVKIYNNLKNSVFVSQFESSDVNIEMIFQNSSFDFFYTNSFVNNEICFFKKSSSIFGRFVFLCKINFKESTKPIFVEKKGFESFEVLTERDGEDFIVRLNPALEREQIQNWRSTGPKIKKLIQNTLKNRSHFPFNLDLFKNTVPREADQQIQFTMNVKNFIFSVCDENASEIMLIKITEASCNATKQKTDKKILIEVEVKIGDIQADCQMDFKLHNVK